MLKNTESLKIGERFKVGVYLSADEGKVINNLRQIQFDFSHSEGVTVKKYTWKMKGLKSHEFYYLESNEDPTPTVARANYISLQPVDKYIINLTDVPMLVGRYRLVYRGEGKFDLLGDISKKPTDWGIRFQSGFRQDVITYSVAEGNVKGGVLNL